ncbi:MAG: DUF1015 domain-containing protein [Calditrichaeota bacterium]|jgi:uncharacterized protein (DUF1015 family)|nr:DUF1015 domain-containing protein [Calditrichota bacterium]MBT7619293.1 DUF1015 domain-containing protein [Calditrichota bacterium]MBT7787263.1 DUF1015 domain-containing protein [Calditrichota bacterium]
MAKIAAFRGYRFNKMNAGDLNKVVTQPYDQIGDELRADYHGRSDYNVVRIIKGIPTASDTPNDNEYTRAAKCWEEWIDDRVLTREPGPAIYPYFQEYDVEGKPFVRKGLIALIDLDDKKAEVKAHEHTHSGPKADRLRLMKATEANDGQIFMLYNDAEQKINAIIDQELIGAQPLMTVKDDFGATHKLYRISRPGAVADIADVFKELELFIADGHHRFETAVNYMNYCKDRKWAPVDNETFTHRMMTMVNMHDPGLSVLPTHRVIHSLDKFKPEKFLKKASDNFDVTDFADLESLSSAMDAAYEAGKTVFGFGAEGMDGLKLLTLKNPGLMDQLVGDAHCEGWRKLDVTVLHTALLDKLLGIGADALEKETNVRYVRGRAAALDTLGKDGIQAVFLINATKVSQVSEVASAGERMPQKSTDFFPKLLSGMVMMKMQIDKSMGLSMYEAD